MSNILGVNIDPPLQAMIHPPLTSDGHKMRYARDLRSALAPLAEKAVDLVIVKFIPGDGCGLLEQLRVDSNDLKCLVVIESGTPSGIIDAIREHVCDFLTMPFSVAELRSAVGSTLTGCPAAEIEVASANPEWVELRLPGDLAFVAPLQKLLTQLEADLPAEVREATGYALGEMLNNAIEHGCKLDRAKRVEVSYVRLKRGIMCRIKDPGGGFDPAHLEHAAINNPNDDPIHHSVVRDEKGMRPGGLGILLTRQLVDELVYNERHNELMFMKYLS
jgi:anti-sigma regulatory factor (Ser/Thr protein kinase)/ActR/RegA family two-component response regulator